MMQVLIATNWYIVKHLQHFCRSGGFRTLGPDVPRDGAQPSPGAFYILRKTRMGFGS